MLKIFCYCYFNGVGFNNAVQAHRGIIVPDKFAMFICYIKWKCLYTKSPTTIEVSGPVTANQHRLMH